MTPRSHTLLLPLLSIFFWINPVSAQNPERTKTIMIPADSAYTKIVQALHESGYYIAKLDRPSGLSKHVNTTKTQDYLVMKVIQKFPTFWLVLCPIKQLKLSSIYSLSNAIGAEALIPRIITTKTKASLEMIRSTCRSGTKFYHFYNKACNKFILFWQ
nr:hypothetical protein [uncultured Sphingobacterium sp.]